MLKYSGIYMLKNKILNKFYIGHANNLYKRKNEHFSTLKSNKHFNKYIQEDYNKYGKENFVFEILLICELEYLIYYEQKYVDILKPEYNIFVKCVTSRKGNHLTESHKKKISESMKGKIITEETRLKISKALTGRHISEEVRKKLSDAQRKSPKNKEKRKSKIINISKFVNTILSESDDQTENFSIIINSLEYKVIAKQTTPFNNEIGYAKYKILSCIKIK